VLRKAPAAHAREIMAPEIMTPEFHDPEFHDNVMTRIPDMRRAPIAAALTVLAWTRTKARNPPGACLDIPDRSS
jgi:hypothetical protein